MKMLDDEWVSLGEMSCKRLKEKGREEKRKEIVE
jgi:hypothetical protein